MFLAALAFLAGVPLSGNPLGVNVSPRQPDNPVVNARINRQLGALGPIAIRYGGGTLGDAYFYDVNRDTYDCTEQWTSDPSRSCSRADTLNLGTVENYAHSIGANVMPIANYGSGTPALAAGLAAHAVGSQTIELGNEPYGCSSIINELTEPPVNDIGYEHGKRPNCPYTLWGSIPGIEKMGISYNTYAPQFINAIKAANPAIKIELPYAISPKGNSGYGWNDITMPALRGKYNGIVVLWYPSYDTYKFSDAAALNAIRYIPGEAASVNGDIKHFSPYATWQIGETNDTNSNNVLTCRPAGAVFAAADALSWLARGASNVNWWDESDPVNSGGHCTKPDFAMFDSTGYAQPPYTGYWLAAKLAQPHAVLTPVATGNSYLIEFHAKLRGGHQAVEYINLSTSHTYKVKGYPLPHANLPTYRYSTAHPKLTGSHTITPKTVTAAPASVTVFTD